MIHQIAYELWDGATHNRIEYTDDWNEIRGWVEWIAAEWPEGCLKDIRGTLYLYDEPVDTKYGWGILTLGS